LDAAAQAGNRLRRFPAVCGGAVLDQPALRRGIDPALARYGADTAMRRPLWSTTGTAGYAASLVTVANDPKAELLPRVPSTYNGLI
jgi:hypothetical protein